MHGSLLIWLNKDMRWNGSSSGKRGRMPMYSDAAVQFCLTIKDLFNLPLRQAMGITQSLLKLSGLSWKVPDFSTVSWRQKHLSVTIALQSTTTGMHLLVDTTVIKMLGEGELKTKKHGADYRRQWRKVHLGIDAATLEILAIKVTDNATGDAPILSCLLDQILIDEMIASVSGDGDGDYDTKGCHEAIAQRGVQAIIPTRKNARPWKDQRPGERPQYHSGDHVLAWQENLEEMGRVSSAQSRRDQDALHQIAR